MVSLKRIGSHALSAVLAPLTVSFFPVGNNSYAQSLEEQYNNRNYQQNQENARLLNMWRTAQFTGTDQTRNCKSRSEDYNETRYLLDSKNGVYMIIKDWWLVSYMGTIGKYTYTNSGGRYTAGGNNGENYLSSLKLEQNNGRTTIVQFLKAPPSKYREPRVSKLTIACLD
jgi:hypothetical protein